MQITTQYLEKLIIQARENGASSLEIEELEDYLQQIKSGKLKDETGHIFTHKKVDSDGKTIIHISTAPITTDTDDDFADLTPKPIKRRL